VIDVLGLDSLAGIDSFFKMGVERVTRPERRMSHPRQRKGPVHEPPHETTGCPFLDGQHFFALDDQEPLADLQSRARSLARRAMIHQITLKCNAARAGPSD